MSQYTIEWRSSQCLDHFDDVKIEFVSHCIRTEGLMSYDRIAKFVEEKKEEEKLLK